MAGLISNSKMIYGTAWKKEKTAFLVKDALVAGFRAVDVAAQPKHYREELVGEGIRAFLQEEPVKREALYVQTKFSWPPDLDADHLVYDPESTISTQVTESVAGSLFNIFGCLPEEWDSSCYLDCVLLHSPLETWGKTVEAWKALERFVPDRIRNLGISNVSLQVLELLCNSKSIDVRPKVVQNRFCGKNSFDTDVRRFCDERDVSYQAFWILTANPQLLASEPVKSIAREAKIDVEVALYGLVSSLGCNISVLNGTTKHDRMVHDIASYEHLKYWKKHQDNGIIWDDCLKKFKILVGDTAE